MAALDEAYRAGPLELRGVDGFGGEVPDDVAWLRLKWKLYRTKWVSYAKPPFANARLRPLVTQPQQPPAPTPSASPCPIHHTRCI